MIAARWRLVAAVVCVAVSVWAAWFTAAVLGEWFSTAFVLAVPALVAVLLGPTWRSGVVIVGLLVAMLVGLVLVSTSWPGALRPPQRDWVLPYLVLSVLACVAGYAVRVRQAPPDKRKTLLMFGAGGLAVLLCLGAVIASGPAGGLPGSGVEEVEVDRHDLLPFPAALDGRSVTEDCDTGTGVCSEVLEVWSRSGQSADAVLQQLVQHLRTKGWPMAAAGSNQQFTGCLPMRGVLRWADRICADAGPAADYRGPGKVRHTADLVVLTLAAPETESQQT